LTFYSVIHVLKHRFFAVASGERLNAFMVLLLSVSKLYILDELYQFQTFTFWMSVSGCLLKSISPCAYDITAVGI